MIAVTHVYQEYGGDPSARSITAAALRAVAAQLGEELEFYNARVIDTEDLLAIADELEAQ